MTGAGSRRSRAGIPKPGPGLSRSSSPLGIPTEQARLAHRWKAQFWREWAEAFGMRSPTNAAMPQAVTREIYPKAGRRHGGAGKDLGTRHSRPEGGAERVATRTQRNAQAEPGRRPQTCPKACGLAKPAKLGRRGAKSFRPEDPRSQASTLPPGALPKIFPGYCRAVRCG